MKTLITSIFGLAFLTANAQVTQIPADGQCGEFNTDIEEPMFGPFCSASQGNAGVYGTAILGRIKPENLPASPPAGWGGGTGGTDLDAVADAFEGGGNKSTADIEAIHDEPNDLIELRIKSGVVTLTDIDKDNSNANVLADAAGWRSALDLDIYTDQRIHGHPDVEAAIHTVEALEEDTDLQGATNVTTTQRNIYYRVGTAILPAAERGANLELSIAAGSGITAGKWDFPYATLRTAGLLGTTNGGIGTTGIEFTNGSIRFHVAVNSSNHILLASDRGGETFSVTLRTASLDVTDHLVVCANDQMLQYDTTSPAGWECDADTAGTSTSAQALRDAAEAAVAAEVDPVAIHDSTARWPVAKLPYATTTGDDGIVSTNDLAKLAGIASGAEVNVQSDWDASSGDAFIQNKPTTITTDQAARVARLPSAACSNNEIPKWSGNGFTCQADATGGGGGGIQPTSITTLYSRSTNPPSSQAQDSISDVQGNLIEMVEGSDAANVVHCSADDYTTYAGRAAPYVGCVADGVTIEWDPVGGGNVPAWKFVMPSRVTAGSFYAIVTTGQGQTTYVLATRQGSTQNYQSGNDDARSDENVGPVTAVFWTDTWNGSAPLTIHGSTNRPQDWFLRQQHAKGTKLPRTATSDEARTGTETGLRSFSPELIREAAIAASGGRRPTGVQELPVPPFTVGQRFILLQTGHVQNPVEVTWATASAGSRVTGLSGIADWGSIAQYGSGYSGSGFAQLRGKTFIVGTIAPRGSRIVRIWWRNEGESGPFSSASVSETALGSPFTHYFEVTGGLAFGDTSDGDKIRVYLEREDGTYNPASTDYATGDWTANAANTLIPTPGSAASWAESGNTDRIPRAKLPREGFQPLISGSGIGVTVVSSNTDSFLQNPTGFTPAYDLSEDINGTAIIEITGRYTLGNRSVNTIGFNAGSTASNAELTYDFSGLVPASTILSSAAYDGTTNRGVKVSGTATNIHNGSATLGEVALYLARDGNSIMGYVVGYDGSSGSLRFVVSVDVTMIVEHSDIGPAATAFTELTDTPETITANQCVQGNSTGSALEFDACGEANVQSDWNAASGDAFIRNKPTTISTTQTTQLSRIPTTACTNGQVWKSNAAGVMSCQADATGGGGGTPGRTPFVVNTYLTADIAATTANTQVLTSTAITAAQAGIVEICMYPHVTTTGAITGSMLEYRMMKGSTQLGPTHRVYGGIGVGWGGVDYAWCWKDTAASGDTYELWGDFSAVPSGTTWVGHATSADRTTIQISSVGG